MSPLMMTPLDKSDLPLSSIPIFMIPILPNKPIALNVASSFSDTFVDDNPDLTLLPNLFRRKNASVFTTPPPSENYLSVFISVLNFFKF